MLLLFALFGAVLSSRMAIGLIDMNMTVGADTTLFNVETGSIFQNEFKAVSTLNTSIKFVDSLAVPVFMWYSGFPIAARENAANQLRANLTTLWPTSGNGDLSSKLSNAASNVLGVTPTSVTFSSECGYDEVAPSGWTTPSPSSTFFVDCDRSVAFLFRITNNVGSAAVKSYICSSLDINCSSVVVGVMSAAVFTSGSVTVSGFEIVVNVSGYDPLMITTLLCNRAASPSQLSFLYGLTISINGVVVYTRGSVVQSEDDASFQDCMENLWYLLILLLLIPISYVITSVCYQRGKRRGRVVAQEQDDEAKEKAKQMLSQQSWQNIYFPQQGVQSLTR